MIYTWPSSCIPSVSDLNCFSNSVFINNYINLEMLLVSCLSRIAPFCLKLFKLFALYLLNFTIREPTFNSLENFWKAVSRNSMSDSSECSSVSTYGRRLAADGENWEDSCGRGREGYEVWTRLLKMSSSLKDTCITKRSTLMCEISVTLKVLLIFFSFSTYTLIHLNSATKSPRLIFVFLACGYSSSSRQYALARGSKILTSQSYQKWIVGGGNQTRSVFWSLTNWKNSTEQWEELSFIISRTFLSTVSSLTLNLLTIDWLTMDS